MSLPMSVTSALVGTAGDDSSCRQISDRRMAGNRRHRKELSAPYDRPWPSAATIWTSGPHADRAVETTVWKPRVRLLAPIATTRAMSPGMSREGDVAAGHRRDGRAEAGDVGQR